MLLTGQQQNTLRQQLESPNAGALAPQQQGAKPALNPTPASTALNNPAASNNGALSTGNLQYNAGMSNQAAQNVLNQNSAFNKNQFNEMYNPYINNVVNANTEQSWRNFNQQTAPALQSQFGLNGQFGSARGTMAMEQAARDNSQQTNWQNAQLMQSGYNDAMKATQQQQQNNIAAAGGLTNAGTAGWNMANQQYLLPYQMMGAAAGASGALRPESGSISNGANSNSWIWG